MDYMDPDVCCPKKAVKLNHSLTHPGNQDIWHKNNYGTLAHHFSEAYFALYMIYYTMFLQSSFCRSMVAGYIS